MRPSGVSWAGRGKAARRWPSILRKVAGLLPDLLQGTRPGVKVWTIPSQRSVARCLLAVPQCVHFAAQGSCVRAEQARASMLQPGRVAWRLRAWLRIVPRAGSALRQAAAAPLAQVGKFPCGMRRGRGRDARAQCRPWNSKVLRASDPHCSARQTTRGGRVAAHCSIAERHAQGGVLSTAGWRRA